MAQPVQRHRFLMISHSFGRRLKDFCNSQPAFNNLGMNVDYVNLVGTYGNRHNIRNISFLRHANTWLQQHGALVSTVDISLICLGSNDILDQHLNQPRQLAEDIFQLANDLILAGSKRVVILPVLFRSGRAAVPRNFQQNATADDILQAEYDYRNDVIIVNQRLMELCASSETITFRNMRGLIQNWRHKLSADGVHLRPTAMRTFFNNVRSAFVVEKGKLQL